MLNQGVTEYPGQLPIRPFASEVSDLDVDFQSSSAYCVSQLLQSCIAQAETDDVWQWTLARRLQTLIELTIATRGDELELEVTCQNPHCHETIDLPILLSWFRVQVNADHIECRVSKDSVLGLRLPNAQDQINWLAQDGLDDWDLCCAQDLITSVNHQVPAKDFKLRPDWLETVEQILEQHDELMTLELETECAVCGYSFSLALDLEQQLLALLLQQQQRLLRQIHTLAANYHWNESEIMALSVARRHHYLGLLQQTSFGS